MTTVKKKRKPRTKRDYFTQDTEDAILKYLATEDSVERESIYNKEIRHSMEKLVECITNSFSFDYVKQDAFNVKDVEKETLSYLIEILNKYKQEKGKAYSYLGTIAKRRLINLNKKSYKDRQEVTNDVHEIDIDKKTKVRVSQQENEQDFSFFLECFSKYLSDNIEDLYPDEDDKKVVNCFLELLHNAADIEIFNKNYLYFIVKEKTGLKSYEITRVFNQIKLDMKDQLTIYHNTGGDMYINYDTVDRYKNV